MFTIVLLCLLLFLLCFLLFYYVYYCFIMFTIVFIMFAIVFYYVNELLLLRVIKLVFSISPHISLLYR